MHPDHMPGCGMSADTLMTTAVGLNKQTLTKRIMIFMTLAADCQMWCL